MNCNLLTLLAADRPASCFNGFLFAFSHVSPISAGFQWTLFFQKLGGPGPASAPLFLTGSRELLIQATARFLVRHSIGRQMYRQLF